MLKSMFKLVFYKLINLVRMIQFCSINKCKIIQIGRNIIYAYHRPNVTEMFCDFFFVVVVHRGKKPYYGRETSLPTVKCESAC